MGALAGIDERDCYGDPFALLERDDIDAVSIATPPNARVELVSRAAAAGKHVVCEKPLALTLAQADEMIEVCQRAGVQFTVYHNYLYFPETKLGARADRSRCDRGGGRDRDQWPRRTALGRGPRPTSPGGASASPTRAAVR